MIWIVFNNLYQNAKRIYPFFLTKSIKNGQYINGLQKAIQ